MSLAKAIHWEQRLTDQLEFAAKRAQAQASAQGRYRKAREAAAEGGYVYMPPGDWESSDKFRDGDPGLFERHEQPEALEARWIDDQLVAREQEHESARRELAVAIEALQKARANMSQDRERLVRAERALKQVRLLWGFEG